jgi:hypothetical protein
MRRFHQSLADCQAQTDVPLRARTEFVRPVEAVEDMGKVFSRDANAGVGDGENRSVRRAGGSLRGTLPNGTPILRGSGNTLEG